MTHKIDSVLALGYPAEEPEVEESKDSCRYWKEADGTFHVPKRRLKDVLHLTGLVLGASGAANRQTPGSFSGDGHFGDLDASGRRQGSGTRGPCRPSRCP